MGVSVCNQFVRDDFCNGVIYNPYGTQLDNMHVLIQYVVFPTTGTWYHHMANEAC